MAGRSISLEQLAALNAELAALARAGIPLDRGLAQLGKEMPGPLGGVAQSLAQHVERGASLAEALTASGGQLPPGYRALVEAGLYSGRFMRGVELLAESLRRLAEVRRVAVAALVYLICVVALATACGAAIVGYCVPSIARTIDRTPAPVSHFLETYGAALQLLILGAGAVTLALLIGWSVWSGKARALSAQGLGAVPGFRSLWRSLQSAQFCELMALLVQNEVPLHRAVQLAADTLGDRRTAAAAADLGARLERGEGMRVEAARQAGFPPFVTWLLAMGRSPASLARVLHQSAESHRIKAIAQAAWLRRWLPLAIVGGLGGLAVCLYAMLLLVPYAEMLRLLARATT